MVHVCAVVADAPSPLSIPRQTGNKYLLCAPRRLTAMANAPASAEESVGPETSMVQQQLDQLQILKERLTAGGAEAIRRLSDAVSGAAEAVANAVTPPPYAVPRLEPWSGRSAACLLAPGRSHSLRTRAAAPLTTAGERSARRHAVPRTPAPLSAPFRRPPVDHTTHCDAGRRHRSSCAARSAS